MCYSIQIKMPETKHAIYTDYFFLSRSQWPHGIRLGSATARLLELRVGIPPGAWMSVSCEYCVLLGRGLCVEPICRPEESYQLRARVCVCVRVYCIEYDQIEQ
jgi:hypothetical protein